MFNFSVIELVEGDLLDDVWHRISAEDQGSIVAELVEALEKIHSVRPCEKGVKEILWKTLEEGEQVLKNFDAGVFGDPHTGFLNDGPALLGSIMKRRKLKKVLDLSSRLLNSNSLSTTPFNSIHKSEPADWLTMI
jgi:hypothetical protein